MTLNDIVARGNRGHHFEHNNRIMCKDGFSLSVIAGGGAYSDPRPELCAHSFTVDEKVLTTLHSKRIKIAGQIECDYPGPYHAVEVGYPTDRPEPWNIWSVYVENEEEPTSTVYSYVPVELVRTLIESHGGEANA